MLAKQIIRSYKGRRWLVATPSSLTSHCLPRGAPDFDIQHPSNPHTTAVNALTDRHGLNLLCRPEGGQRANESS